MFIFFGGTGDKTKDCGLVSAARCGRCGGSRLRLFHHSAHLHLFFIPIFKFDQSFYLVCEDCGATFPLPNRDGRTLLHDPDAAIPAEDLRPTGEAAFAAGGPNRQRFCFRCGAALPAGALYCPGCGHKVS